MRTSRRSCSSGGNGGSNPTLNARTLNRHLPVWTTGDLPEAERMDNNFFATAYAEALDRLKQLAGVRLVPLQQMVNSVFAGVQGSDKGDVPVIEGISVLPNCIRISFDKFVNSESLDETRLLREGDILCHETWLARRCCIGYVLLFGQHPTSHRRD